MFYYGSRNDWWDYLEHGFLGFGKGSEKANHQYYMRIQTGTRNGKNVYRYFYSKDDYQAYIRSGKKKLTGDYGYEKHPNGRIATYVMEQYEDKDGKLQTRKKYLTKDKVRQVTDGLRDAAYRKEKAQNETSEEKAKRMKYAKKRYQKETAAARRKRAVQKGAQTISRFFGRQLDFKKAPETSTEKRRYKKSKWKKNLFIPNGYTRKLAKKKK